MDSVFAYHDLDNPLQRALDKKCKKFFMPETDANLCIFPIGRTDNQQPICKHTRCHLDKLTQMQPDKKNLHIGVGGLFNFDIAAAGGHDAILLVDINPAHVRYMKKLVQTLATSDTRAGFVGAIYHDPYMQNRIPKLMEMKWLTDEKSFAYLHALAKSGNIFVAPLNIYNDSQCKAIREWIDDSGFTPATIYTSNILEHGLNHTQVPLREVEIAALADLTRAQQDRTLYKRHKARTSYQSSLPRNVAATFNHNLDLLSSEDTLSFIAAELPFSNVMHPRILIEGKVQTPAAQHKR